MLLAGTVALAFAVGGRWDVALAAWVFPVLLLRFSRTSRVWPGALWIWLAHVAAAAFWLLESDMGFGAVMLGGGAALGVVQTVPFLLDRLMAGRLRPWAAGLLFPAAFAGAEFLITLVSPFGTAFGSLAVTQHDALPLLQVGAVTGPYGIAFLIGWAAAAVNRILAAPSRCAVRNGLVCGAVLAAVVAAGGARPAWFPGSGATVRIAGVSPARALVEAQRTALDREEGALTSAVDPALAAVLDDLLATTRREAAAGAKIVVWPETAVKTRAARERAVVQAAREQARRSRIYLEIGVRVFDATGPGRNETLFIGPDGAVLWTYQKAHPIPGSESYPPGDGKVPVVATPYGRIANVICYDADFPDMMRVRADIMLVPSHDWREYGRPHTAKAGLRAVENGYALVRQDSEGFSAAFDGRGRVLATADYFTAGRQTMVADVPTHGGTTPYTRLGDLFAWLCLAATAALLAMGALRPAARPARPRRD
ncbi:Apolipoprotein N-acyltransferase [Actinomadura sp. RB68]|uniref:Apolipoprotein N-acyltransferase n=1 Tax=Actinomadura macrotermitis TaxID=2585200 RepID=A0A7K0C0J9_9ACTN|nr:Apolipoprotein N-acyltransferase [Actinomadura macrotermitis]